MKKNNFFLNYSKNGYFITKPLINYKELCNLREDLDEEFKTINGGARLGINKIKNQKLVKKIVKIFSSNELRYITEQIEISLKKNFYDSLI